MSSSYTIEIETQRSLKDCMQILLKDIEYEIFDDTDDKLVVRTPYFMLSFRKLGEDDYAYSSQLGLRPKIQIYIYSSIFGNIVGTPMRTVIFMNWVRSTDETANLLYQGECVLLLSKSGTLFRNADSSTWRGDTDNIIDKEYTLQKFPIL